LAARLLRGENPLENTLLLPEPLTIDKKEAASLRFASSMGGIGEDTLGPIGGPLKRAVTTQESSSAVGGDTGGRVGRGREGSLHIQLSGASNVMELGKKTEGQAVVVFLLGEFEIISKHVKCTVNPYWADELFLPVHDSAQVLRCLVYNHSHTPTPTPTPTPNPNPNPKPNPNQVLRCLVYDHSPAHSDGTFICMTEVSLHRV